MITKGTQDYKRAQELANALQTVACYERAHNNSLFKLYYNPFFELIGEVKKLDVFAAQVAETIDKNNSNPYSFRIANMSSKQAWIIACAVIEAGIDYTEVM